MSHPPGSPDFLQENRNKLHSLPSPLHVVQYRPNSAGPQEQDSPSRTGLARRLGADLARTWRRTIPDRACRSAFRGRSERVCGRRIATGSRATADDPAAIGRSPLENARSSRSCSPPRRTNRCAPPCMWRARRAGKPRAGSTLRKLPASPGPWLGAPERLRHEIADTAADSRRNSIASCLGGRAA